MVRDLTTMEMRNKGVFGLPPCRSAPRGRLT